MNISLREITKIRKEFLNNGKQLVWHGISYNHLFSDKNNTQLQALTTQRYWRDGKIRKDNEADYNTSCWYHGWSTSRSFKVSSTFGEILIALDLNAIKRDYPVKTIAWNYTIGKLKNIDHKKEQEEFIVAHKGKYSLEDIGELSKKFQDKLDLLEDKRSQGKLSDKEKELLDKEIAKVEEFLDKNWYVEILGNKSENEGKGTPLDLMKYAKGFFLVTEKVNLSEETIDDIKRHPLYLGELSLKEINPEYYETLMENHRRFNSKAKP